MSIPKTSPAKTTAIIGAGYTGLVAAYRLANLGYNVDIYEAGSYPGGLAGDFTIEGAPLEMAYHHLFKTDHDIITLAKELGIGHKLKWHDSSLAIYYNDKLYPFMTPKDLLTFAPISPHNRVRAGAVVFYLQKQKNWKQFVHHTAYDWMRKHAGKQVSDVIWEPLLKGKFAGYYDKVSMAWLWARLHIRANSREKGDANEKLGYFEDGFKVLTDALVTACKKKGVRLHTGAKIEHIASGGSPHLVIGGKKKPFDAIVATVPSHVFAKLIDGGAHPPKALAAYSKQLTGITYLGALLMVFSSDQDISKYYWHNINDTTKPFLVFIHHTKLIHPKHYGGKHVYYIGAYLPHDSKLFQLDDTQLSKLWFGELKKIFPDFAPKHISEKHIFRLRNAQHIVDTGYQSRIPAHKTPLKGVFLSNFSQIFPEDRGTNYAVREGNKIADLAGKYLRKR